MCALVTGVQTCALPIYRARRGAQPRRRRDRRGGAGRRPPGANLAAGLAVAGRAKRVFSRLSKRLSGPSVYPALTLAGLPCGNDRKSVVEGKSVSVRVDLGGRRIFKKKMKKSANK